MKYISDLSVRWAAEYKLLIHDCASIEKNQFDTSPAKILPFQPMLLLYEN